MNEAQLLMEYAKCWNNLDVSYIEPYLDENLEYTSQWVFETMQGKNTYLNYLKGKFAAIRRNIANNQINADIGFFRGGAFSFSDRPCLVIKQFLNGNVNKVCILIKADNGKIVEIAMCGIPHPDGAELFEIYPK